MSYYYDEIQETIIYLNIDSALAKIVDSGGQPFTGATSSEVIPAIVRGMETVLRMRFLKTGMTTAECQALYAKLAAMLSWECALANDWDTTTTPQMRADNDYIEVCESDDDDYVEVKVPLIMTNTDEVITALGGSEATTLNLELVAYAPGKTKPSFLIQVKSIPIRNRIFGGGDPTEAGFGDYWTSQQTIAYFGQSLDLQFSEDGSSWHDTQTSSDDYVRIRFDGGAEWGDPIRIPSEFPIGDELELIDDDMTPLTLGSKTTYQGFEIKGTIGDGTKQTKYHLIEVDKNNGQWEVEEYPPLKGYDWALSFDANESGDDVQLEVTVPNIGKNLKFVYKITEKIETQT